jgi:hypothetical protein
MMQLDDITIHIRQRSPWEAIDLGFAMVQHNWRGIFPAWSLLLFSISLMCWLLMPSGYEGFSIVLLWWLKPLYDRVLLHIVSHQMLNQSLSTPDIFSALPGLVRNTGFLGALTFRRLSLSRGFNLPIWQLEQLRGLPHKERQELLHLHSHLDAVLLMSSCRLLGLVLIVSFYVLILMFDPTDGSWDYIRHAFRENFDTGAQYWGSLVYVLLYVLAVWIIEPFYMSASFSLYLNRRTQLEAWDIELAFRSLGDRLRGLAHHTLGFVGLLVMTVAFTLPPFPAQAADSETGKGEYLAQERLPAEQSKEQIESIMKLDEFSRIRMVKHWQARKQDKSKKDFNELSASLQILFANILKSLLWLVVIVLVVLAFVYRQKILAMLKPLQRKPLEHDLPDILFGMDIRPESLPDNLAVACRRLWESGQHREALGLLYRGALMHLTRHDHLLVQASHTEGDILQLARKHITGQRLAWLTAVTRAWQGCAYAHRIPVGAQVIPLFDGWGDFSVTPLASDKAVIA